MNTHNGDPLLNLMSTIMATCIYASGFLIVVACVLIYLAIGCLYYPLTSMFPTSRRT